MRRIVLFALVLAAWVSMYARVDSRWTDQEIRTANTAATCPYLSQVERDVILYNNLARLYPKKFVRVELEYQPDEPYLRSLVAHLNSMQSLPALAVHERETELAKCWAKESGEKGVRGHNRVQCDKFFIGGSGAENCSYGCASGRSIILQLLIDKGVSSLGHRKSCLSERYVAVGVGFATHKTETYCCVMDFTSLTGETYPPQAGLSLSYEAAHPVSSDIRLSADELQLYELLMKYRQQHRLPRVPLSPSLTRVAKMHAQDIYDHFAEIPEGCYAYTWSAHGSWTPFTYCGGADDMKGMWAKPRELTAYPADGIEIIHHAYPPESGILTAEDTYQAFIRFKGNEQVIVCQGSFASSAWRAVGIGMYKGVACVWWGDDDDPVVFAVDPLPIK